MGFSSRFGSEAPISLTSGSPRPRSLRPLSATTSIFASASAHHSISFSRSCFGLLFQFTHRTSVATTVGNGVNLSRVRLRALSDQPRCHCACTSSSLPSRSTPGDSYAYGQPLARTLGPSMPEMPTQFFMFCCNLFVMEGPVPLP